MPKRLALPVSGNSFFLCIFLILILIRVFWILTPIELDEGYYLLMSSNWISGQNPYEINDIKPPMLYLTYFPVYLTPTPSFMHFRIFGFFIFLFSLVGISYVAWHITKRWLDGIIAGCVYTLLMCIPLFQGFYLKPGTVFNLYFIISLVFLINYFTKGKPGFFLLSSLFYSIALLTMTPNALPVAIYSLLLLYFKKKDLVKIAGYLLLPLAFGILFFLYFYLHYQMNLFSALLTKYLGMADPNHFQLFPFHNRDFVWLFFEAFIPVLILAFLALYRYRSLREEHKISFIISVAMVFFYFSFPSFGHHVVYAFPLLSIFSGAALRSFKFSTGALALLLAALLIISNKYYPAMNQYDSVRFHDFSSLAEQEELARYIAIHLKGNQTFGYWGWNPAIYWLTEKEYPYPETGLRMVCPSDKGGWNLLGSINMSDKKRLPLVIVPDHYSIGCPEFNGIFGEELELVARVGNMSVFSME